MEVVVLCCKKDKGAFSEPYCIKDIIYDLAALGGRKGVPSDGVPSVKSLWEGMLKLYTLFEYREFLVGFQFMGQVKTLVVGRMSMA